MGQYELVSDRPCVPVFHRPSCLPKHQDRALVPDSLHPSINFMMKGEDQALIGGIEGFQLGLKHARKHCLICFTALLELLGLCFSATLMTTGKVFPIKSLVLMNKSHLNSLT